MRNRILLVVILAGIVLSGDPQNAGRNQQPQGQHSPTPAVPAIGDSRSETEATGTTQKPPEPHAGVEWSNWALVLVGAVGVYAAIRTLKAIEKQAKVADATLVAQFRPKVVIRKMQLDPPTHFAFDARQEGIWKVVIQIANIGGTKAVVTDGFGYFQEYKKDYPQKDLSVGWVLGTPLTIQAGQRVDIDYILDAPTFRSYMEIIETSTVLRGKQPARSPIFHGRIRYRDDMGTERETGFGREWDVVQHRFVPLTDPEFEYQD